MFLFKLFVACSILNEMLYMQFNVLALCIEGIVGGETAKLGEIPYQVAIVRKNNEIGEINLLGSGSIIAKNLVMTIAQCFLHVPDDFDNYEYLIVANTTNWKNGGIEVGINEIFLPGDGQNYLNDIIVASLMKDLDIDNKPHLSKVSIPKSDDTFYKALATVSGYGYNFVAHNTVDLSPVHDLEGVRSDRTTDNYLRHAMIDVENIAICSFRYTDIDTKRQFCGRMINNKDWLAWGLCDNDIGSPVVLNNMVIGLASRINSDCDDSDYGSVYTQVSAYAEFVNSIIDKNYLPGTIILNNIRPGLAAANVAAIAA